MARDPYHVNSKKTYACKANAWKGAERDPKATGHASQLDSGRWVYLVDCLQNRAELEQTGEAYKRHLSATDHQLLQERDGWKVTNGTITLTCPQTDDPRDRRFVITGPSGTHTLQVSATCPARLNAHWLGFRDDQRNRAADAA